MKVGTITFHASYNYGAMLQAYALQQALQKMGADTKIINFRSKLQKNYYGMKLESLDCTTVLKWLIKQIFFPSLRRKRECHEQFLNEYMTLTPEYTTLQELEENCPAFDAYISGSDQIWNTAAFDFSEAYLLPFANKSKRIAYAVSFGPDGILHNIQCAEKMKQELSKYSAISVREHSAAEQVYALIGKQVPVVLDPVHLLPVEEWNKLADNAQSVVPKKKYILLYAVRRNPSMDKIVNEISAYYHLPVLITMYTKKNDYFSPYMKRTGSGPLEFLALLKNAEFVFTSSFHGMVFSILFNKPFFAFNGAVDVRKATLLNTCGLVERAIDLTNASSKIPFAFSIDFSFANAALELEIKKSKEFLMDALFSKVSYAE